ncbi:MAG: hypothetical protein ABN482_12500 [Corticimicrobacter sp.]|uniref:DUF7079 family protein n=1 Tax=Corticimicrobacter sp. TaxID=2678536 RepID=UPI0032DB7086
MAGRPTDRELVIILSEFFLDTETDYAYLARATRDINLPHIETALLEWVAPVLWGAYFATTPEWAGYDPDWLWQEAQAKIRQVENAGSCMKGLLAARRKVLAWLLKEAWNEFLSARKALPPVVVAA